MLKHIYSEVKDFINEFKDQEFLFCNFIEIYNEEIYDLLSPEAVDFKEIKDTNKKDAKKAYKKKVYLKERDKKFIIQGNIKLN